MSNKLFKLAYEDGKKLINLLSTASYSAVFSHIDMLMGLKDDEGKTLKEHVIEENNAVAEAAKADADNVNEEVANG